MWGLCSAGEGVAPPERATPCIVSRRHELEALMVFLLSLGQRRAPVWAQTPRVRTDALVEIHRGSSGHSSSQGHAGVSEWRWETRGTVVPGTP